MSLGATRGVPPSSTSHDDFPDLVMVPNALRQLVAADPRKGWGAP